MIRTRAHNPTRAQTQKHMMLYQGVASCPASCDARCAAGRSGLNGRYRAQLSTKGKTVHLGTFSTAEEAARCAALVLLTVFTLGIRANTRISRQRVVIPACTNFRKNAHVWLKPLACPMMRLGKKALHV
jgi:hypothetical protein